MFCVGSVFENSIERTVALILVMNYCYSQANDGSVVSPRGLGENQKHEMYCQ